MAKPLFDRVAIIGIGLIGSSLARVLRRDSPQTRIVACARRAETLEAVRRLKIADEATDDPAAAVKGADLVVIATPLSAYAEIAAKIAPALADGAIVTDVGSVKEAAIRDLLPAAARRACISCPAIRSPAPSIPGPEAGFAEMFADRWCILTPLPETASGGGRQGHRAVAAGEDEGRDHAGRAPRPGAGGDLASAASDRLHHRRHRDRRSATICDPRSIAYSAGGFRDFTRIAASDPVMWRDIFLKNREAVLEVLQRFSEDLTALQRAIRRGEGETLEDWFTRTRAIRRSIIEAKQA